MIKQEFTLESKHGRPFLCDVRYEETHTKKPIILFIHGFKGFKDWGHFNLIADYFAQNGFVYVKINLSHNGTDPENPLDFVDLNAFGENNFSIELDDIGVLINHLFSNHSVCPKEEVNLEDLYLVGHSRGGALALLKTAEDPRVKKVVTFAAIHDLEKRWPESLISEWEKKGVHHILNGRTNQEMPLYFQLVEDFRKNKARLDIPSNVKTISVPVLINHGTKDETLDVTMASELASWNDNAELFIIDGANHVFGGSHPYTENTLPDHTKTLLSKTISFLRA